jgi:uncharacterized protein DUF1344
MTHLRITAATAALVAMFAYQGFAQEAPGKTAMGRIINIDTTAGTVTLDDGQTFALPNVDYFKSVKLGDRVIIDYKTDDKGVLVATAVKVAA